MSRRVSGESWMAITRNASCDRRYPETYNRDYGQCSAGAQELEIAKQVQARLFPQTLPQLKTLEYAGVCIPAREVGGDYYDFLNLGRERLGIVIGDT